MNFNRTEIDSHIISCLREVAPIILEVYNGDIDVEIKGNDTPVTIADKKASEIIETYLGNTYPDIPVVSEENIEKFSQSELKGKLYWLIDPIDGTKHFIAKDDQFAVNISLNNGADYVAGYIYNPVADKLFMGFKDLPTLKVEGVRNKIFVAKEVMGKEDRDKLIICANTTTSNRPEFHELLNKIEGKVDYEVVTYGSSLKFCMIAEGKADLYVRFGSTCEWDTSAGVPILQGIGGGLYHMDTYEPVKCLQGNEDWKNPYFIAVGSVGINYFKDLLIDGSLM